MKAICALFFVGIIGLTVPVFADKDSDEELDNKIRELIDECQEKIKNNESMSDAEKTVALRNCETEITNEYEEVEIDYKNQDEKRARLHDMESCEDWYHQYRYLTENQFRIQKHAETVDDCILLYNDSIWEYVGEDRIEKLSERLDEIKNEIPPEPETREINLDVTLPQFESNIIEDINSEEVDLEEKVRLLEEEVAKKDEVIKEQIKIIMELANRIKNIMFEPFDFFFAPLKI